MPKTLQRQTGIKQHTELSVYMDTSGVPGVNDVCVLNFLWCASSDTDRLGAILQDSRDRRKCESLMHFSEIKHSGNKSRLATEWLETLYRCQGFNVRLSTLWVDCNFESRYYGNPDNANNWLAFRRLHHDLVSVKKVAKEVSIKAHIDGSVTQGSLLSNAARYLKTAVTDLCGKNNALPKLRNMEVSGVAKKTRGVSRIDRINQDLIVLIDIDAGAKRTALQNVEKREVRRNLAILAASSDLEERRASPISFASCEKFDPLRPYGQKFHQEFVYPMLSHKK